MTSPPILAVTTSTNIVVDTSASSNLEDTSCSFSSFERTQVTQHPMQSRSKVGVRKPNPKHAHLHVTYDIPPLPKSIITTKRHPRWSAAMDDQDLDALATNKTWILVPPHSNMNVVGFKWVYRAKFNPTAY